MRVISGLLKGRIIKEYDVLGTRPTQDRVKESIFGTIQNKNKNSVFLDLFAGSGSIGIESVSNGANKVYFVDENKTCISNIKKIINTFNINSNCILINNDYKNALNSFIKSGISFDIIYLDPPYSMLILNNIIKYIIDNEILNKEGIIICETDKEYIVEYKYLKIEKTKKYGAKYITILS